MRDFLAWALLISVPTMWILLSVGKEQVWRLFGVGSDEELFSRFGENRRFVAGVGLVVVIDCSALALALIVLL